MNNFNIDPLKRSRNLLEIKSNLVFFDTYHCLTIEGSIKASQIYELSVF